MPVEGLHAHLTLAAWTNDPAALKAAIHAASQLNMPRELCLAELLAAGGDIDVGLI